MRAGDRSTTRSTAPTPFRETACGAAKGYDPERGRQVIAWARRFLDESVPLASGSHAGVKAYSVKRWNALQLPASATAPRSRLRTPASSPAIVAAADAPERVLLVNNGLHIEIVIDRAHPVGRTDDAGVADVVLEAALTTIMDLEDLIAAVDPFDKVAAYRNWLGLCQGTLVETFRSTAGAVTRRLAEPTASTPGPTASRLTLPGRSLMLVRNVGHLMTDVGVLDRDGQRRPRRHPRCRDHQR